jgi:hypothetical protein
MKGVAEMKKLRFKDCQLHPGKYDIETERGKLIACCFEKDTAKNLTEACNEHDTLKAKADLIDWFVGHMDRLDGDYGTRDDSYRVSRILLEKAEALT